LQKKTAIPILAFMLLLSAIARVILMQSLVGADLISIESQIVGMVNGTNAYNYDLELEKIAFNHSLSHYSFRSAGSSGANATADWILEQFESFGLESYKEEFQFTNWEVLSEPTLLVDEDGNPDTSHDQSTISTFQCVHYSWPTPPAGVSSDLVVLPLPPAASRSEIGVNPINQTEWNAIDTTGKNLLIGREVRWDSTWEETYINKLAAQTPAAVIYTWWYDWMAFTPPVLYSAGGRPGRTYGPYYWDLEIPVGFVSYDDGFWIRSREDALNVSAKVSIETIIDYGPHYNAVGKLRGCIYPEKFVIISSHYDTVTCSGFCDNGAGTAGVIELARIFSEANQSGLLHLKYTILFLPFTSEEIGLVGSVNYVMQHEAEMEDIIAVINLDCVGSDDLYVAETNPGPEFDLDELVLGAAQDLGINATLESGGISDDIVFKDPGYAEWLYSWFWDLTADIADANPVESSTGLIAYPLTWRDEWSSGTPGWIHTSYDNSSSTETLDWIEIEDLENHIKVAALTIMRISYAIVGDINGDGWVELGDFFLASAAFGSSPSDPNWNSNADINNDDIVELTDFFIMSQHFGEHYP